MRRTSRTNSTTRGFTLIEVLVVAPIALLAVAALVVTIVTMTGSAIRTQVQTQVQYDVLAALARVEEDIESAAAINGSSTTVIDIDSFATSRNPADAERQLYDRTTCQPASAGVERENALLYSTNYRVDGDKLVRRVQLDHGCGTTGVMNWMKRDPATLIDAKGGTVRLTVTRPTSSSVEVTLTVTRTVAGEEVSYTGVMQATSRNV